MQFFDVIGVDADGKTVLVAQALLDGKDTDSYRWVFQQLKKQLNGLEPSVIMSDGDPAIAAAIATEFPNSRHCLCVWHWKGTLDIGLVGFRQPASLTLLSSSFPRLSLFMCFRGRHDDPGFRIRGVVL